MFFLVHSRNLNLNMKKISVKLLYYVYSFRETLYRKVLYLHVFFSILKNTIEQIAAYGDKRDISLIIAIYMTQARICTKGLNRYSIRGITYVTTLHDYTLSRDRKKR